ncbi:MAG: DUF4260 family protein [Propionibacteriales bacterium]|nr:DUF4260 family protein [Propionibacteriales bacterium]
MSSTTTPGVKPDHHWIDDLTRHVEDLALHPVETRIATLDAAVAILQARRAEAIGEFDQDEGYRGYGFRAVSSFVRVHLNRSYAEAGRIRKTARLLPQLDRVREAFAAGRINADHVRVFVSGVNRCGLDALRTHEATLVELAERASSHELQQAVDALAELVDPDRDEKAVKALGDRYFHGSRLGDMFAFAGMVDPDIGEALQTAVDALAKPVDDDTRTRGQRMADAFSELVRRGINTEPLPENGRQRPNVNLTVSFETLLGLPGSTDLLSTLANNPRIAAYLRRLAHQAGAETTADGRSPRGWGSGGNARTPHVPTQGLSGAARPAGSRARLERFGPIPTVTAQRLVCDGLLTRIILDPATGSPLEAGRTSRLTNAGQDKALAAVYTTCAFPHLPGAVPLVPDPPHLVVVRRRTHRCGEPDPVLLGPPLCPRVRLHGHPRSWRPDPPRRPRLRHPRSRPTPTHGYRPTAVRHRSVRSIRAAARRRHQLTDRPVPDESARLPCSGGQRKGGVVGVDARANTSLPRALLHVEGAVLLAMAVLLYAENGVSWWLFLVLLLAPDVGMVGYLGGTRTGAVVYNLFHAYPAPGLLAAIGVLADRPTVVAVALIWFAHIGMDRLFGYGLKYPTDFKDTHLGHV